MTEEQYEKINKNAEKYLNRTPMQNPIRISSIRNAYIAGATEATKELEKENEQLTISYETLKLHDEEEIEMLKSENAELEEKLANADYQLEGRDNEIRELQKENERLKYKEENYLQKIEHKDEVIETLQKHIEKAKEIISEWEDSFCCGADYLYLGNKGKELRIKSQKFLNGE